MDGKKIRIGTRGSQLALAQTELVREALTHIYPELECEIVVIRTTGDKILNKPLLEFGGKGVFIDEFEEALLRNEIDIAVHSAKDMPMCMRDGLDILGVLNREDPRDVLITMKATNRNDKEVRIGTSSLRRQIQIEELYDNIMCSSLRGNVNTRLQKLSDGLYDGIILAAAGIKRLNLDNQEEYNYRYFDIDEMVPAGGQAIIAIEGKKDSEFKTLLSKITDSSAKIELEVERNALKLFNAGCHEPIGIYSKITGDEIEIWMMIERNGKLVKKKESTTLANRMQLVEKMVNNTLEEL